MIKCPKSMRCAPFVPGAVSDDLVSLLDLAV